jgi:hypothetical protein
VKRGLIAWDKTELPPEAFESRLAAAHAYLAEHGLPALIVYSDLWRSNQGRYFSNFMPYFNRALLVIPGEGAPLLLCGLSPRVYPWIKSVTILPEILPSPNLPARLLQLCAERGWSRLGVLDFEGLPHDLHSAIDAGLTCVDVPSIAIRPVPDRWELAMHKQACAMARAGLAEEMPPATGAIDYEFFGRLERRLRREGAEDLVILVTNGDTVPAPARGQLLHEGFSVSLALEYRGHWAKVARTQGSDELVRGQGRVENLSGPLPYIEDADPAVGSIVAHTVEATRNGRREFRGDTFLNTERGFELL